MRWHMFSASAMWALGAVQFLARRWRQGAWAPLHRGLGRLFLGPGPRFFLGGEVGRGSEVGEVGKCQGPGGGGEGLLLGNMLHLVCLFLTANKMKFLLPFQRQPRGGVV